MVLILTISSPVFERTIPLNTQVNATVVQDEDPVALIREAIQKDEIPEDEMLKKYAVYGGLYLYGNKTDFDGVESLSDFDKLVPRLNEVVGTKAGVYTNTSDLLYERLHKPMNDPELSFEDFKSVAEDEFYYTMKALEAELND